MAWILPFRCPFAFFQSITALMGLEGHTRHGEVTPAFSYTSCFWNSSHANFNIIFSHFHSSLLLGLVLDLVFASVLTLLLILNLASFYLHLLHISGNTRNFQVPQSGFKTLWLLKKQQKKKSPPKKNQPTNDNKNKQWKKN